MTILMCVNRKLLRMKSTAIQENNLNFKKNSFIPTYMFRPSPVPNKKYFLDRALLQHKAKRPREILPPTRTFCFDHFTVENQINTRNEWYGDSKAEDLQRLPYSKRALLKEAMFIVAIVFKVLQSGAGVAWRKKLRHKIINQACCLPVTKLSLCFVTFTAFKIKTTSQSLCCTDWFA